MREHVRGVILVILLGLFALAGALISGTQATYAHEISARARNVVAGLISFHDNTELQATTKEH